MSIIEKAVNRLNVASKETPATPELIATDNIEPTLEARVEPVKDLNLSKDLNPKVHASEAKEARSSRLVNLDARKLIASGMISPEGERSQISEEFRLIKRPLLANAFGQGAVNIANGNLIMVTSSYPGEGKSFCATNLALSIAMELDRTVLLVDADVAKPSLPKFFGFEAEKGLLDLLLEKNLSVADVLLRTSVPKLTILPAGRTHKYATELLASEVMNNLIEELANRYADRIIIFDSPPLLVTSEASVLATHMGQIVLVVEAEKTPREKINEALGLIDSCEVVGLLLNKGSRAHDGDYYYGSYGN